MTSESDFGRDRARLEHVLAGRSEFGGASAAAEVDRLAWRSVREHGRAVHVPAEKIAWLRGRKIEVDKGRG